MHKHSFAQQILSNSKIKIYSGDSQILQFKKEDIYNLADFNTKFTLRKSISTDDKKISQIDSYNDLLRMGFQISKQRASGKYFEFQKVEYFIVKANSGLPHIRTIPLNHIIEYNYAEHWIRLVGKNSSGKKVFLKRKRFLPQNELPSNFSGNYFDGLMTQAINRNPYEVFLKDISPFTFVEQEQKIPIPEIPLLKTADGTLVCLPQTKDNPTIGTFGKKGMGKSLILHRLADCVYNKWKKRVFICNDGVGFQTKSWSLPWSKENSYFLRLLESIGESTRPLPCVYLFPNILNMGDIEFENDIGFRITLPFKDIMVEPNSFFEGTKDELFKSEKYLKNLIYNDKEQLRPDGLLYINPINPLEDIKNLINEKTWVEQEVQSGNDKLIQRQEIYTVPEASRNMVFSLLKELMISRIFDKNTNISSKWIVEVNDEKYDFYPWDACLFADVVPVLVTSKLRFNKYYAPYERFIFNDVFQNQNENEIIKRNKLEVWLFIDEIQDILQYAPAKVSFTMVNKEARNNRMGIAYATQFFGDIPEDVLLTTDYIISFRQTATKASEISKNFDLMAHQQKELITLKKFNAMVAGKVLVTYDTEGNREVIDDGTPFKGLIFPSVSQHSAPKEEGI